MFRSQHRLPSQACHNTLLDYMVLSLQFITSLQVHLKRKPQQLQVLASWTCHLGLLHVAEQDAAFEAFNMLTIPAHACIETCQLSLPVLPQNIQV